MSTEATHSKKFQNQNLNNYRRKIKFYITYYQSISFFSYWYVRPTFEFNFICKSKYYTIVCFIAFKTFWRALYSKMTTKKTVEFPLMSCLENIHILINLSELTVYYYNNKLFIISKMPVISFTKSNIKK